MNALKALLKKLNLDKILSDENWTEALKNQPEEIKSSLIGELAEDLPALEELVTNPSTREEVKSLFQTEELFWAFLRKHYNYEKWFSLVTSFIKSQEGPLLLDQGFFDNGLPYTDNSVDSALSNFILATPDYFTWQYLSDSFLEKREGIKQLEKYRLKDRFFELVIPQSSGEELYNFFSVSSAKKLPELTLEQKTKMFEVFFKESKSDNKFKLWESNNELSASFARLFYEVITYLPRETSFAYFIFMLEQFYGNTKAISKTVKLFLQHFSTEEISNYYATATEPGFTTNKKGQPDWSIQSKKIPDQLASAIDESRNTKEIETVMAGNLDQVTNIQLFVGKKIPYADKAGMAKAYLKNSSEYLKIYYLSDFFKASEKKPFFEELRQVDQELAQEFLEKNYEAIKLDPTDAIKILPLTDLVSKLSPAEMVSLIKTQMITIDDLQKTDCFKDIHSLNHELIAALAKANLLTEALWSQIAKAHPHEAWISFVPQKYFNKFFKEYKNNDKASVLLIYPNITPAQRQAILENIPVSSYHKLLQKELTKEEILALYEKTKDKTLKQTKEILPFFLNLELDAEIKQEICERILKATDAFIILLPYINLLDDKTKTKLITASLKNKDQILEILNDANSDPALRSRALRALFKFEKDLTKFILTCDEESDLLELSEVALEKSFKPALNPLLGSKLKSKLNLINHFKPRTISHELKESDLVETLSILEISALLSFVESYTAYTIIDKLSSDQLKELSKIDSKGAIYSYLKVNEPFPSQLLTYAEDFDFDRIFISLSPQNRKVLLEPLLNSAESELDRGVSAKLTRDEWSIAIQKSKARWASFYTFITEEIQPDAWVIDQFKVITNDDSVFSSFIDEVSKYELNRIFDLYPLLKTVNDKLKTSSSASKIYQLKLTDLISSDFTLEEIIDAKISEKSVKHDENEPLVELIRNNPGRTIPILLRLVEAKELELKHLVALSYYITEYELDEYLTRLFTFKLSRINGNIPRLFSPSNFSHENQVFISDEILTLVQKDMADNLPNWVFDFLSLESLTIQNILLNSHLINIFLNGEKSSLMMPKILEFLKNTVLSSYQIKKIIRNLDSGSQFVPVFISLVLNNHMDLISLNSKTDSFSVLIGSTTIYEEINRVKTYSLLSEAQEKIILNNFKKEIFLPEEISGTFNTLSYEFTPDIKVSKQYITKLNVATSSDFTEAQLQNLNHNGIETVLPAKLYKEINEFCFTEDDTEPKIFYTMKIQVKDQFIAPVNEELQELLIQQKGIFSQLEEFEKHLPISTRRWGFELEFSSSKPRTKLGPDFKKQGFNINVANNYHKSDGETWDFKQDSSLASVNGGFTIEVASPILISEEGIREATRFLNYLFTTTKVVTGKESNSGLHVHHEVKDIISDKEQISHFMSLFTIYQEPLFALCAPYRQKNDYCAKLYSNEFNELDWDNRDGFNFSSRGTLEFRMREALPTTAEIIRWIKLTQKIVEDVAQQTKGQSNNFKDQVLETINLLEQEKLRQLKDFNSLDGFDQFLAAKEYSKILLSHKNRA